MNDTAKVIKETPLISRIKTNLAELDIILLDIYRKSSFIKEELTGITSASSNFKDDNPTSISESSLPQISNIINQLLLIVQSIDSELAQACSVFPEQIKEGGK